MAEWINWIEAHQVLITAIATVVIAVATVIYSVLTYNLAAENRLLRKAGTEPVVVVYLLPDARYGNVFNFVIENIGRGPARNVRFAFEADAEDFLLHKVRISPTEKRKPISVLPQGGRVTPFFGMGPDLLKESPLKPFFVRVSYENIKGKRQPEEKFELNISEFLGLLSVGTAPEYDVADALKKIAGIVDRLNIVGGRLKTEVITTEEVERRDREWIDQMQRRQEGDGGGA